MPSRPPTHRPIGWRPPEQRDKERRAAVDKRRGSAASRGYDHAWSKLSKAIRAAEPLCRACRTAGRVVPAECVDHIIPVEQRPDLRLEPSNLQPLCWSCHGAKTGAEDGGFGNPRRRGGGG